MKVRIKKSPKTGDQRDYSLTTHRPWFPTNSADPDATRNTIGAVPRQMANIEAEGGETVLGDINNDGNIEHMTITGKRHTQGGVPLQIPPGSFVFSDTNKMKIKDPAVLKHFGMGGKTGGYTPATIAKQYQLNDFMKKVNDPSTDALTRRTAEMMLNNNMQKLSELAAYQEGMKGKQPPAVSQQMLPDGGQQIAESAEPNEEYLMQQGMDELEMAYGGRVLPKAQTGISKGPDKAKGYWDRVTQGNMFQRENDKDIDPRMGKALEKIIPFYGEDAEGFGDWFKTLLTMPQNEINHLMTGYYESPMTTASRYGKYSDNQKFWGDVASDPMMYPEIPYALGKGAYKLGAKGVVAAMPVAKQFGTLVAHYGVQTANALKNLIGKLPFEQIIAKGADIAGRVSQATMHMKSDPLTYERTKAATQGGKPITMGLRDGQWYNIANGQKITKFAPVAPNASTFTLNAGQLHSAPSAPAVIKADGPTRTHVSGTPAKLKTQSSKTKIYDSFEEALDEKWNELQDKQVGGQYQHGGNIQEPQYRYDPVQRRMVPVMQNAGSVPANDGENEFVEEIVTKAGKGKRVTRGNKITTYDQNGEVVVTKQIEPDSKAYDAGAIDEYKKQGIKVILPKQFENNYGDVMIPGRQGQRGKTGVYGKEDYWDDEHKADFQRRFPTFMQQTPDYDPKKNVKDGRFQNWYNGNIREVGKKLNWSEDKIQAEIKKHGFINGSKDVNGLDEKHGEYTWSRPTYDIDTQPTPTPGTSRTVYRCPDCQPVQITGEPGAGDFESQARCHTECASVKAIPGQKPADPQDMWLQDKVSMAAVAGMDPYYGNPAMFQTNLIGANPQLEEYSAKNAAIQSNASMAASQINQSADPTAARANIAAIVGQSNQQGLNEIANIQNRNVNTTNDFAKFNAGIQNQENASNTQLRKQFFDETNVYGQNLQNFENQKEMQMANAFNRGVNGLQTRNMFRAIYPQYDVDPNSGAYRFNEGMDFTNPSVGYATTGASSQNMGELVNYYKKQLEGSIAPDKLDEAAIKFAEKAMAAQNQTSQVDHKAMLRANPGMALTGMTGGYNPF